MAGNTKKKKALKLDEDKCSFVGGKLVVMDDLVWKGTGDVFEAPSGDTGQPIKRLYCEPANAEGPAIVWGVGACGDHAVVCLNPVQALAMAKFLLDCYGLTADDLPKPK